MLRLIGGVIALAYNPSIIDQRMRVVKVGIGRHTELEDVLTGQLSCVGVPIIRKILATNPISPFVLSNSVVRLHFPS